ncbi:S1C family serine protease [Chitinophagaceae bacterium LWZ2-11]
MNIVNEDIIMLQAIERYLDGVMLPEEKAYFEELRKNTPEIDQMVVEHSMFLHQMDAYSETRNLKHTLHDIHSKLLSTGVINDGEVVTPKGKVIQLYNRFKKDMAIAACVAGAIALITSALVTYISPAGSNNQLQQLSKQIDNINKKVDVQGNIINDVNSKINDSGTRLPKGISYISGGTGFLIDGKGYIVTNAHILKGSGATVVNNEGKEFNAKIVNIDAAKDLAILKIDDSDYKTIKTLPYSIGKTQNDLGEEIFTLGYPRNDVTYTQGYLSAKTGYKGDSSSYQIQISSNPGNSGGPVLNKDGEVIGVLSTKQMQADGVTFAIKSKNIYALVSDLIKSDTTLRRIKMPTTSYLKGKDRSAQVKKIEDCVFQVKAYNSK